MAPRVLVVVKRTAYGRFVEKERDPRLTRLIRADDPSIRRLVESHAEHARTTEEVHDAIARLGIKATWVRRTHARFDATGADLVLTVGGDGTLLAASHSVGDVPILGVNSSPRHSVGFFCGTSTGDVRSTLEKALAGRLREIVLARMAVLVNDKPVANRVLNDALFCHSSPAATSRYRIKLGRIEERQKSSGFWIGPAAGSTAAQRSAGGEILPLTSRALQLVVREPYRPVGEWLRLTHALVKDGHKLVVQSEIREGMLFIDGPDAPVQIERGDYMTFKRSSESVTVLGLSPRRDWRNGTR
jgi:NAD+ kinase